VAYGVADPGSTYSQLIWLHRDVAYKSNGDHRITSSDATGGFRKAGFGQIVWHAPKLSPEGLRANDREFWSTFLDHSPVAFIECVK
jgi:hypothetical protein